MRNSSKNRRLDRIPKKYKQEVITNLGTIAEKIKKRRVKMGFTQESFAEALNVEPTTVQSIEQMRGRPSLELLLAIVKILGMKITLK